MAVKGILKGLGSFGSGSKEPVVDYGPVAVVTKADSGERLAILDDFEHAGIGWLWATDEEGRLIYISEKAADALDCELPDLLASPLCSLFETDPDDPNEKSDRPLKFQLTARNKIQDLTLRFSPHVAQP